MFDEATKVEANSKVADNQSFQREIEEAFAPCTVGRVSLGSRASIDTRSVESGAASQKPKVPLGKPAGFSEKSHRLARWFFRLRVGFPLISIIQVEKFLLW